MFLGPEFPLEWMEGCLHAFKHMKVCFPAIISFLKCFVASVKICKAKNSKFPCYLNGKIEVLTGTFFCNAKAKSLELGTFYDQNITKKPGKQSFSTKSKNRSTLIIHISLIAALLISETP